MDKSIGVIPIGFRSVNKEENVKIKKDKLICSINKQLHPIRVRNP